MSFLTGQRLTADLLNQYFQGVTTPVTADSATFTTVETIVATFTAPLVSGQVYEIIAMLFMHTSSSAATPAEVALTRIREDNVTGTQLQGANIPMLTASSGGFPALLRAEYTAVATATKTFVITGIRNGGAGTMNLKASASSPCLFRVQPLVN